MLKNIKKESRAPYTASYVYKNGCIRLFNNMINNTKIKNVSNRSYTRIPDQPLNKESTAGKWEELIIAATDNDPTPQPTTPRNHRKCLSMVLSCFSEIIAKTTRRSTQHNTKDAVPYVDEMYPSDDEDDHRKWTSSSRGCHLART
jgi:hypothetical protein